MLVCKNCLYYLRHFSGISFFPNHSENGSQQNHQLLVYYAVFHVLPLLNRSAKKADHKGDNINFSLTETELT